MKKLLLAAMGTAMFASLASATNVSYVVGNCYSYGLTSGAAPSLSTGTSSGTTSFVCPTAASLGVTGLNVLATEFLVYNNDWTGLRSASATSTTVFNFSTGAGTVVTSPDTLTSGTNGGTSALATSASNANPFTSAFFGGTFNFGGNQYTGAGFIDAGFYDNGTNTGLIAGTYNTTLTAGNVQGLSSYVDVVYGYTTTTSTTPEPSSLLMMGSALIGLGALKFRKRK